MQYTPCPQCQGNNPSCNACGGSGQLLETNGHTFAWQKKLSPSLIYSQKILRLVRQIIDGGLFVIVIFGIIMTVIFTYNFSIQTKNIFKFFIEQNIETTIFWLTLVVALYLYYRISNTRAADKKINHKKLSQTAPHSPKVVPVESYFSYPAGRVVENAYMLAFRLRQPVLPTHLALALLAKQPTQNILNRLSVDIPNLRKKFELHLTKIPKTDRGLVSKQLHLVLTGAFALSVVNQQDYVTTQELLYSLVSFENAAKEILFEIEIDASKIGHTIEWFQLVKKVKRYWSRLKAGALTKPKGPVNRAYTATASPLLDQISDDLTQMARLGSVEPVLGSEKTVENIFKAFTGSQQGVLLVGETGTGKTAAVDYLAELMAAEDVPPLFQDKRLVKLSVSGLIAGASALGATEKRLLEVLREVGRAGNIILFIDRTEELVGLGTESSASMDLASSLADELNKNYFILIASTTPEAYQKYIEKSPLNQALVKAKIPEMSIDDSIRALCVKSLLLENKYNLFFSYQALEQAVDLSAKLMPNQFLPGKAVQVLEATAQKVANQNRKGDSATLPSGKHIVLAQDVAQVVSEMTKIPVTKVTAQESAKLLHLEEQMHQRIIGQDEAVQVVANALRRARTKVGHEKRPIASFLFLGPTGVGKTEVARVLSDIYFGGQHNIIRLDMSEYGAQDAIPKLIGFAGADQPGYLIQQIKQKPFSLLLLDELEKASSEVHNLFLQVMEDGRMTDNLGKTYNFNNTIIIGTSNAASTFIQAQVKNNVPVEQIKESILNQELVKYFKPEFINRFDAVTVFKPLTMDEVEQITSLLLNQLIPNLAEKGIGFEYTKLAVQELAQAGFDPQFGARPLRRVIQDRVENKIAEVLLTQQVKRRDKLVLQSIDKLEVKKAEEL